MCLAIFWRENIVFQTLGTRYVTGRFELDGVSIRSRSYFDFLKIKDTVAELAQIFEET